MFFLSALVTTLPANAADWLHFARPGDTLWDLCLEHTNRPLCWIELQEYNAIENDRQIPVDTLIRIPATWLKQPVLVGSVLATDGEVWRRGLEQADLSSLVERQDLYLGDAIRTDNGAVMLSLISGATILLRPESRLILESFSTLSDFPLVEILLDYGEAEAAVDVTAESMPQQPPQSYYEDQSARSDAFHLTISTATADAALNGSARFHADEQDAAMQGEVISGHMAVSAADQTVIVPEGFGISAESGDDLGAPRRLLAAPKLNSSVARVVAPVRIEWPRSTSAVAWRVDLMPAGDPTRVLVSETLTEPVHIFNDLSQGCYEVAVRAIDNQGLQGMEDPVPLCVVPAAPVLGDPQESRGPDGPEVAVQWEAVAGAVNYQIEVSNDPEFSTLLGRWQSSNLTWSIDTSENRAFYVRVRATNEQQLASDYSDAVHFERSEFDWLRAFFASFGLLISLL